jgi:5,10-methenyltetrahydrofolate synthetase
MANWQETNPDDLLATHLAGEMTKPFRKKAMREELRRKMAEKSGDSAGVVRQIAEYLAERPHLRVVALFAPMPGEVDLLALTKMAQKIWAFPKVTKDGLIFHQVSDVAKDLQPGAFGILEPTKRLPLILADEIDLFLCPGLGFDTRGGRIGRGKGFYDEALAEARAARHLLRIPVGGRGGHGGSRHPHARRDCGMILPLADSRTYAKMHTESPR